MHLQSVNAANLSANVPFTCRSVDGREFSGATWGKYRHCMPATRQGFPKQTPERVHSVSARSAITVARRLRAHNEEIADLVVGLTGARKTWGFGLCFLHQRNVKRPPWNRYPAKHVYMLEGAQAHLSTRRQAHLLRVGIEPAPSRPLLRYDRSPRLIVTQGPRT